MLEVTVGGGDLSGFAEAAAEAIQHHVRVRPVEGVFGVAGEGVGVGVGVGVGAQGLGEISVSCSISGQAAARVSAASRGLVVLVGGMGVAGSALDELVDVQPDARCRAGGR
ncbi:hypothetical protein [Streptomyces sp. NPDC024089]|uniref:hypothetical protein n=1 Tax=Streptomyces sp. NPDC024089 TaxID=3154328 RepID=UPI0033E14B62